MKYWCFLFLFFICFEVKANELCFEDNICYNVEVMKTDEELQRGLMWVKELPEDNGMLFDFRRFYPKMLSMWMKNTYISLDMVFIGCDNKIKDIYKNAKPLSLDKINSNTDFCYVLEINGGLADKKNISIGYNVYFNSKLMSSLNIR